MGSGFALNWLTAGFQLLPTRRAFMGLWRGRDNAMNPRVTTTTKFPTSHSLDILLHIQQDCQVSYITGYTTIRPTSLMAEMVPLKTVFLLCHATCRCQVVLESWPPIPWSCPTHNNSDSTIKLCRGGSGTNSWESASTGAAEPEPVLSHFP